MREHDVEQVQDSATRAAKPVAQDATSLLAQRAAEAQSAGTPNAGALNPQAVRQLQRAAGNASVGAMLNGDEERSPVLDVVGSGGGAPLNEGLRTDMESRFGEDFGDVRVHSGSAAETSAASVQAKAYTVGNDVVLGAGAPTLDTDAGRHTLAHELTHVVQQRSGPVDGTPTGGGIAVSSPGDSYERAAERNADRVMSGDGSEQATPAAPSVQREAAEGEEEEPEEPPA